MRISESHKPTFKGFFEASAALESRPLWSRALVAAGNDVGWIVKANNKFERQEKNRRLVTAFLISFVSPIVTLPLSNRIAMKYGVKLTKSLWTDSHKMIHISNKYLHAQKDVTKVAQNLKEGFAELSSNYTNGPLENLYRKITGKSNRGVKLNFDDILSKCDGDYEKLRKKLVNAKIGVLSSDLIITGLAMGLIDFVNNSITKNKSCQSGFSAEFKMADKDIVEKRANNYDKTVKKRLAAFFGLTAVIGLGLPLAVRKGLNHNTMNFLKKKAHKFDYNDGIYMSRLAILLGAMIIGHSGTLMASRNTTELKDKTTRFIATDTIFLGGDLLFTSILANLSDKVLKTNITKPGKNGISKLMPDYKSLTEINQQVKKGEIPVKNKIAATGIFWTSLAAVMGLIGWGVPTVCNKMIKKDVQKDISINTQTNPIPNELQVPEVFSSFKTQKADSGIR